MARRGAPPNGIGHWRIMGAASEGGRTGGGAWVAVVVAGDATLAGAMGGELGDGGRAVSEAAGCLSAAPAHPTSATRMPAAATAPAVRPHLADIGACLPPT